jgi:hypothetical protein
MYKKLDSFAEAVLELTRGNIIQSIDEDGDICDTYETLDDLSAIMDEEIHYEWQVKRVDEYIDLYRAVYEFMEYGTGFQVLDLNGAVFHTVETIEDLKQMENPNIKVQQIEE